MAADGALACSLRSAMNIGGRTTPLGFSRPMGKSAQVKQGPALGVPRRVPGTTKVQYTNERGRTFSFSIPVAQLTHPPTVREGASPSGWRDIDTSYADTGDIEEDLPSPIEDILRKHTLWQEPGSDAANGDVVLRLDDGTLHELQAAFVDFCKQYVLMDTQGMKTSLSYGELNNGADYEMYDRKSMRKRYWLSIRHRYEDIRDILWPSALLSPAKAEDPLALEPLLGAAEMLEALSWLEAASTFCVRSHRAYDIAGAEEFLPLDLSQEARVLARRVQLREGAAFFTEAPDQAQAAPSRVASDRFITCAGLCAKYDIPFSAFLPVSADGAQTTVGSDPAATARALLALTPPLGKAKDAIRVMSILDGLSSAALSSTSASGTSTCRSPMFAFSDPRTGSVNDVELLDGIAALCGERAFGSLDALDNAGETELCVVLRFVVAVLEQNAAFFAAKPDEGVENDEPSAATRGRSALDAFTRLALSRCRALLYRLGGPQTGVMSGDDEYVPFVEMQRNTEASNPQALVHYKIGMENAMGMRFVRLGSKSSAALVELLDRLEATGASVGVHTLVTDLVQHVAQKAAMGRDRLALADVIRVLPLLAKIVASGRGPTPAGDPVAAAAASARLQERYSRLFAAMSTTIGAEMQHSNRTPGEIADLLEGLALCRHVPSSYKQVEMVLLRMSLLRQTPLPVMTRCLSAMARLVGPRSVSHSVMQSAAAMLLESQQRPAASNGSPDDALALARVLYHCHYGAFPSLVASLLDGGVVGAPERADGDALAARRHVECGVLCALAASSLAAGNGQAPALAEKARSVLALLPQLPLAVLKADLLAELITSCAALGIPVPCDFALRLEPSTGASGGGSAALHSLVTPILSLSLLESLEDLGLVTMSLHGVYLRYVEDTLALLAASRAAGGDVSAGLLPDDADVTVRALQLREATPAIRELAGAILEREVMRLDATLHDAEGASGIAERTGSFEQTTLLQRERAAESQAVMLRYLAAIQNVQSAQSDSTASGAAH